MNIHEYQARELFERFGVPTPKGNVAATPEEAEKAASRLNAKSLVVKAQIHAGGRGKGTFESGFQGGVHLCASPGEARDLAEKMLGQTLVTHQTGPEGKTVNKVMIAESVDIANELYLALLMDREQECPVIVASTEGGMDIERVAAETPDKIIRENIHPALGFQPYQARKLSKLLGFSPDKMRDFGKLLHALHRLFIDSDCSLVEINPLVVTTDDRLLALDAKFNFDDNALFRHPTIAELRDPSEEDPREVEASEFDLNYIGLEGNIGCMVNGAGLAMSTMDIIKHFGGDPANFLDVGGGATEEQVTNAFRILVGDPKVKAILVNIFGGIMKCDIIAQGIINAAKSLDINIPLIVRLEGTNVKKGRQLLDESGIALTTATDLSDAAQKAVASISA